VIKPRVGTGGLGFAIPVNTARRAVRDVLKFGRIIVPWIGIAYTELTEEMAQAFDLPVKKGVVIGSVAPGSPASRARIKRGDIIVTMDRKAIEDASQIQEFIREAEVGKRVRLTLIRDSKRMNVTVVLEEMPREMAVGR